MEVETNTNEETKQKEKQKKALSMPISLRTRDSTTTECLLVYDNGDGFRVEKSLGGTTVNLLLECRWADIRACSFPKLKLGRKTEIAIEYTNFAGRSCLVLITFASLACVETFLASAKAESAARKRKSKLSKKKQPVLLIGENSIPSIFRTLPLRCYNARLRQGVSFFLNTLEIVLYASFAIEMLRYYNSTLDDMINFGSMGTVDMLRYLSDDQAIIPATTRENPDPAQQTITIASAPYAAQTVAATSVLQTVDMGATDASLGTLWVLTRVVALRFWSTYMATFAPILGWYGAVVLLMVPGTLLFFGLMSVGMIFVLPPLCIMCVSVFGLRALLHVSVVHLVVSNIAAILHAISTAYYAMRSYFKSFVSAKTTIQSAAKPNTSEKEKLE